MRRPPHPCATAPAGNTYAALQGQTISNGWFWHPSTPTTEPMSRVGYLVWVVVASDLPPGVRLVLAIPAVLVLLLVKPSFGRVPKDGVSTEREAPQLHRLVREVAAAAGTPVPDVICVDLSLNAGVARLGWRQRSVLVIGIPLWVMLPRPARVSLLAHELGHLANGDPLRVRRTLPARTFGARAVAATGGRNPWRRAVRAANSLAEQRTDTARSSDPSDLWSTHPSEDQRMRLIEALPGVDGALTVDDTRWAGIDTELAPWRRTAHNALLGTRDRF